MTNPNTLLLVMINAVLVLALAALLISPMVFFFAALAGTPLMLSILVIITLTSRAKAPTELKA